MSFSFLLLGHLIGDFTFQTEKIALNKAKKKSWNVLHAAIVTGSMLFFSLPFGLITMCLVLLNGVLHYFIDSFKSKLPVKSPVHALFQFLVDQFIHISLILLISLLSEKNPSIFINEAYIKILVIFVFVVFFMSIFVQYLLKIFFPSSKKVFFLKHEKLAGDLTRFTLFVIFLLSFWLSVKAVLVFIPLLVLICAFLYHKRWGHLMSQCYFRVRLMMDLLATTIGFYFLVVVYL